MRNVLIAGLPGDEATLFAPAVLSRAREDTWDAILFCADPLGDQTIEEAETEWRAACEELGVRPRLSLRAPAAEEGYDFAALAARLRPVLGDYDAVYTPSFNSDSGPRQKAACAAAAACDALIVETASTDASTLRTLPDGGLLRLFDVVNRHYGLRLRAEKIVAGDFRAARQYRRIEAAEILHFAQSFLERFNPLLDDDNPFDFETSDYEQRRFALEIEVLQSLPWTKLVEIGACTGTFTERLVNAFPERKICAIEPVEKSFARLRTRIGGRAELRRELAADVRETCDLLFLSSVVYYMRPIPHSLFDLSSRWLVASHGKIDHELLLDPLLHSSGWKRIARRELLPRIEMASCVPQVKGGTEVAAWERM